MFCSFFNIVFSLLLCMNLLYILDVSFLSDISIQINVFSHSVDAFSHFK